jgi:hypothetical protein
VEEQKTIQADALAVPDTQNSNLWVDAVLVLMVHLLMQFHLLKTSLAEGLVIVGQEMLALGDYFGDPAGKQRDILDNLPVVENMVEAEATLVQPLGGLAWPSRC